MPAYLRHFGSRNKPAFPRTEVGCLLPQTAEQSLGTALSQDPPEVGSLDGHLADAPIEQNVDCLPVSLDLPHDVVEIMQFARCRGDLCS